jgi:hypothetical protein
MSTDLLRSRLKTKMSVLTCGSPLAGAAVESVLAERPGALDALPEGLRQFAGHLADGVEDYLASHGQELARDLNAQALKTWRADVEFAVRKVLGTVEVPS